MDPLTLAIAKAVATACVKIYLSSLLGGGISYKSSELGYKVPRWYMNPGSPTKAFYAYGTSVHGDEFESIDDARQRALEQMANHIRLSNQKIIQDQVRYDDSSLKQKRLVELFVRADGLEDFIRTNANVDKKTLVKVKTPQEDMRAFVRLTLASDNYVDYQENILKELKTKLMRQKTEDILEEMDAEGAAVDGLGMKTELKPGVTRTPPPPSAPPTRPVAGADAAFQELDAEVEE